jgi:hypothetical protein
VPDRGAIEKTIRTYDRRVDVFTVDEGARIVSVRA